MRILGIDPGSRSAGFGVIETEGSKFNYIDSGTLKYNIKADFIDRLGDVYDSCREIVEKYSPDSISIESLIYVKNPVSLMKLAQARGAMIAAFLKTHKSRVFEYSPNIIKATVASHGHASKESVQKALSMILRIEGFKSHDEIDAIAIALCHAFLRDSKTLSRSTMQQIR